MPNPLLGGPGIFRRGFLPLDKLPTKADEPLSARFYFGVSWVNDFHLTGYLPIVGARLMRVRACPHVGGPTLCIFRALAAPRSSTVKPEMLDPSYHVLSRGGTVEVLTV